MARRWPARSDLARRRPGTQILLASIRQSGWPRAVAAIGASGLHFHDLRHTGNAWAATSGVGLRDLMVRMGHDSERTATIYQHQARGADATITSAIEAHAQAERRSAPPDSAS